MKYHVISVCLKYPNKMKSQDKDRQRKTGNYMGGCRSMFQPVTDSTKFQYNICFLTAYIIL